VQALDRFRASDNAVLVATDVAARGLDIKDVRWVGAQHPHMRACSSSALG